MASGNPLWRTVYFDLRQRIEDGALPAGSGIDTEQELIERHQVSRNVVRQALLQLQQDGLITRGQGRRGRKVRNPHPLAWRLHSFEHGERRDDSNTGQDDWAAGVSSEGRAPRQEVEATVEAASPAVASALELPSRALVVRRSRVRYVDDEPYQLSSSYFPQQIAEGTLLMEQGDVAVNGGILRHIGHPQARVRDQISIRMPTPEEARRLDIPEGTPVGQHERTGYDGEGIPIRYMVTVFAGDRHFLIYELDV